VAPLSDRRFVPYETLVESRRSARGRDADNLLADAERSDNDLSMGTSYARVGEVCAFVKFRTELLVRAEIRVHALGRHALPRQRGFVQRCDNFFSVLGAR